MENSNKLELYKDYKEGFVSIEPNVFIKTILFGLIFYIIANIFTYNYLKSKLGRSIEPNVIQALIFALLFYFININL